MKKLLKFTARAIFVLLCFFLVCYFGIPSRLITKNIDADRLIRIQDANKILIAAKAKIPRDTIGGFSPMIPDDYGFIRSPEQVDRLSSFLSDEDRNRIKLLFIDGILSEICMNYDGCIRYTIKTSLSNYFINSSWETLYLVYNEQPQCHCEDWSSDGDKQPAKQSLGGGWLRVDVVTERRPIHC